jgi:hypothetical protein
MINMKYKREIWSKEDKINFAIQNGYTCDIITGKVYNKKGKELTRKSGGYIKFYLRCGELKSDLGAHQFIWYFANKEVVDELDHINAIKSDNRIENLRSVTHQENMFNRLPSGYRKRKSGNYMARIGVNGKRIHLGTYKTESEARQAYLDAKKIYHIINRGNK